MVEYNNGSSIATRHLRAGERSSSSILPSLPSISKTGSVTSTYRSSYRAQPRSSVSSQSSSSATMPVNRKKSDLVCTYKSSEPINTRSPKTTKSSSSKSLSPITTKSDAQAKLKSRKSKSEGSSSKEVSSELYNTGSLYKSPCYSNGGTVKGSRHYGQYCSPGTSSYTSPPAPSSGLRTNHGAPISTSTTKYSSSNSKINHAEIERIASKYKRSVSLDGGRRRCSDIVTVESNPVVTKTTPAGNGLVGLKNLGNTCFMNSILQCLSHTCPVRDFFLSREYKGMLCSSSKMQGRLAEEFASLIADMWSGRHDTVSPNKFKSAVAKSAPRFVGYSQQDSQEFLRFFMEGLHEDLNMGIKGKRRMEEPPKGLTDSQLADHRWNGYVAYDNSSIVDIFVGLLKSTLTCSVCDHKSVTFDPFWDLSLPLPRAKSSGLNLQTCFAEFTQEEVLDGDEKPTCENCKKRQKCTKQFSIERFPQLLVLHLKRFSEVRYRTKLSTRVEFPIDNLDLSDVSSDSHLQVPQYDLVGVSNHSGNTFSGHYIAYCRTGSSRWHRFSDSSVGQLSRSDIVSSEAYVLFYERKSSQS